MSRKKFPIRVPRYAAGIRTQESRSGSGRSWWMKRYLACLEGMGLAGRLGRGRNYAMSGQVTAMEIEGNVVRAVVQGTRPDPYSVTLDFRLPDDAAHERIVNSLRSEPMLVARLLADDLPTEVESVFRAAGCDLFPGGKLSPAAGRRYDVITACTCPDYANPCKHTCAALLVIGEEIARRPATLLELRGIAMEELYDED